MSLERITESGKYIIQHMPTLHISEVWINVHDTTYQVDGDYKDKAFFHHYYTVREHFPNPSSTPGDPLEGEDLE